MVESGLDVCDAWVCVTLLLAFLGARVLPRGALAALARSRSQVVIKEGDEGDTFYIIEEGTFSCYRNDGTKLALVDKGSCFGELALLRNERRACNVAAEKAGGALVCRPPLRSARAGVTVPTWILSHATPVSRARNCQLECQRDGRLRLLRSSDAWLCGVSFGVSDGARRRRGFPRAGKVLCLEREAFKKLLGDLGQLRHTWRFEALRRVPLLQQLSHAARSQLCDIFRQEVFPKKARVVTQARFAPRWPPMTRGRLTPDTCRRDAGALRRRRLDADSS